MSASKKSIRIFQIHYRDEQIPCLDPDLIPFNNAGDDSPLLEFNVFRKIFASQLSDKAKLWGAVSWKFTSKTGLSGAQLLDIIDSKPGHDVYFCNPFPDTEAIYHNLWCQGETAHPDFLNLSFDFLQAAELPTTVLDELCPSSLFASTNYFIATPDFWNDYLQFIENALIKAEENLLPPARIVLFSSLADRRGIHAQATYLPFIIERLFGLFLKLNSKRYSSYKYQIQKTDEPSENVHLKTLRSLKDRAIQLQDAWLAECWQNYCQAYVSLVYGNDWVKNIYCTTKPQKIIFSSPIPLAKPLEPDSSGLSDMRIESPNI
jgi:hypothetical protein